MKQCVHLQRTQQFTEEEIRKGLSPFDLSPLKVTAAIGSGFPSLFLGIPLADSTRTRSIFHAGSKFTRRKKTCSAAAAAAAAVAQGVSSQEELRHR